MTPKEKALKYFKLTNYCENTFVSVLNHTIDIALKEQSKQIFEDIDKLEVAGDYDLACFDGNKFLALKARLLSDR